VAPEAGIGAELLPLEAAARARQKGVWATGANGPFDARDVPMTEGRYVLVEGRIARAAPTSIYWYANFGELYRRDFTVRIPKAEERAFVAAGLDLAGLGGRRVRVRGWLFEENGPMIEITHPLALEVLP
jgi:micrococcal nuclease